MGKEIHYTIRPDTQLTKEQTAMLEEAKKRQPVYDEENPPIDPILTPRLYEAALRAVAERNRRVRRRLAGEVSDHG